MKYTIKNRWSNDVIFTAEINVDENASTSQKLGLAVKVAVESGANLSGADLSEADLSGADMSRANLSRANLSGANLSGANLSRANLSRAGMSRANLSRADMREANMSEANMSRANLSRADLSRANLSRADMREANLSRANMSEANLSRANLSRANLSEANLSGLLGNMKDIKSLQINIYPITYTTNVIQIGCECHTIEDWRGFDNKRIADMDGKISLKFWKEWKDFIFDLIEKSPATPAGAKDNE